MKILLTGGGTGGHVYPLIAIAEALNRIADEERIVNLRLYFMSDAKYIPHVLEEQFIKYIPITAGKLRVYPSLQNFFDLFKTGYGVLQAVFKLFRLYPDVVISKGGYVSFPVLFAARLLKIPVIIHESDTVAGRVNRWSGKFAKRIAISFPEAAQYFDQNKVSVTGQPVRETISRAATEGAHEYFELDSTIPTIGILGGSQGAKAINDVIIQLLPELLETYQIIHQTGEANIKEIKSDVGVILGEKAKRTRYHPFGSLNDLQMKMFGGAADVIVSRGGSSIFEIAAWGKPSVIIPYPHAHDDHQRKNAYHYARSGSCVVIEEQNLTASVLENEISQLIENREKYSAMAEHAKQFYKPEAARLIASEAVRIALKHEE